MFHPRADASRRLPAAPSEHLARKATPTMFVFLSRSRYGPLIQVALGVACVVIGLFVLTRILLAAGGLLIVWGIATGIRRLRLRSGEAGQDGGSR